MTIREPFTRSGISLHSGAVTQVRVLPAETGQGRYFVRTDLPEQPVIPANIDFVGQTTLSTELINGTGSVRTVEHLLAALVALGVNDARIEIDGPEIPLLDGSALSWVEAIAQVGVREPQSTSSTPIVTSAVLIQEGDMFVAALPSPESRFTYGIDFADYPDIGNQWYSWSPQQEQFADGIAPARTFGLAEQVEQLQKAGLIKGGSLENALVCSRQGWVNPPLRFANEPVRHKLLDLVGDLSLLGTIPRAHFLAYKASHKLHVQLAKAIRNPEKQK